MPTYNWQQSDWPDFHYDVTALAGPLLRFEKASSFSAGMLSMLPAVEAQAAMLRMLVDEAVKTSEIEGEYLSREDVYSSIQARLNIAGHTPRIADPRARGIGALVVDARTTFRDELSAEVLFSWHRLLFEGSRLKVIGNWRHGADPMQVISGAWERPVVHFEAPPSARVPVEMERFIRWFNETAPGGTRPLTPPAVRAAIVHLYFESIHPFVDGNGRLGRALAEKALAQSMGAPPVMSLSNALKEGHAQYYLDLQSAQEGNEITDWIRQFTEVLIRAQESAGEWITFILWKARFYERHGAALNERQAKVIERMMEEGPAGFEGGINATKYKGITGISKPTATRDLQELLSIGALTRIGDSGGRSTRYALNMSDL